LSGGRNLLLGVRSKRVFEMHPNQHTRAFRVFKTMSFGTLSAQPKMLNRVGICWLPVIQGALVKTKEVALAIIKLRFAGWIGTPGKHIAPPTTI
jgi:hypothetical protein